MPQADAIQAALNDMHTIAGQQRPQQQPDIATEEGSAVAAALDQMYQHTGARRPPT